MSSNTRNANALIHESSPYLLQHAYNPVDWLPWSDAAFEKAVREDKPVIVSIGYSACHWCHVMEKECFEDDATAAIMNEHFICIKVDREERPDIDAIYMDAVQLMTGRGGWPLNCMVMPNQKPIYGGTYFPRMQWQQVLLNVSKLYQEQPEQCKKFSEELAAGINKLESEFTAQDKHAFNFAEIYKTFAANFDTIEGGMNRAPKFPMPSNWEFLLQHYYHSGNEECRKQVELTLHKMAHGGINDQLGGGFARYSTDAHWKVPHFEKMLYDNAQLVSLYSHAFQLTGNLLYKETVYQTLEFIQRELTSPENGFYSALDADSEGVEGKYYVWSKDELEILLNEQQRKIFYEYYKIEDKEIWEEKYYIFQRNASIKSLCNKHNLTVAETESVMDSCRKILMNERSKRIRPGLDDKILSSWNALMMKGYLDAYVAFSDQRFLEAAKKNFSFINGSLFLNNELLRIPAKNGKQLNGFLDDYAFTIDAFILLYQCTGDETILKTSMELLETTLQHFYEVENRMFYYTSSNAEKLISRKTEVQDNVINSSNSVMCKNLLMLGLLTGNTSWLEKAEQMLNSMQEAIQQSTPWYANWAQAAMLMQEDHYEVIICGKDAETFYKELAAYYIPDCILAFSSVRNEENLLFKGRYSENKTGIYICTNNTCQQPVYSVKEAYDKLFRHSEGTLLHD